MAEAAEDKDNVTYTVMITGQQAECSQERFDTFYKPAILEAHKQGADFVVGAADGVDAYAHALLADLCPDRVTVYDKGEKDGRGAAARGFKLVNGFDSYPDRDRAMRVQSSKIIVYLFENALTSDTLENVLSFVEF